MRKRMGTGKRGCGTPLRPLGRGCFALLSLAVLAALYVAPSAQANFHIMKIREVHTGEASGGSYVELQMYEGGQNLVAGHPIVVYGPTGSTAHTFDLPANVANGQNQRTVLIAGPGYASAFPSGPAADATDAGLNLPAAGGAVCFTEGSPPDCVSWGNFSGSASLPAPGASSPESPGGVTAGQALHRSIAAGCPTLLEAVDDTNSSSADFSEQTPNPRANATAVVETECIAPNTTIGTKPPSRTNLTEAEFSFTANPAAGASFECKLDTAAFAVCTSPQVYMSLDGDNAVTGTTHTFQVRAKNADGADPSPATHSWTVDTVAPTVTISSQPANPSSGASAAFAFGANEAVSAFQCSLAKGAEPDSFSGCSSGKTYVSLTDGSYTFKARATDQAGNQSVPASFPSGTYTWIVDNSLADTTPPLTTITSAPPDPSSSPTASFAYASNEPGSTFECKLDGAPFAPCPAAGVVYTGLAGGPHSFQVRASDESGNTDASPAGYSWGISILDLPAPPQLPFGPPPAPVSSPPQTIITGKPGAVTRDRTPTFRFRADVPGSTFACKVDKGPFRPCSSPFTTRSLTFGSHQVQVRAVAGGAVDPTPARSSFRVAKPKRRRSR
jgi:hypothetical protein